MCSQVLYPLGGHLVGASGTPGSTQLSSAGATLRITAQGTGAGGGTALAALPGVEQGGNFSFTAAGRSCCLVHCSGDGDHPRHSIPGIGTGWLPSAGTVCPSTKAWKKCFWQLTGHRRNNWNGGGRITTDLQAGDRQLFSWHNRLCAYSIFAGGYRAVFSGAEPGYGLPDFGYYTLYNSLFVLLVYAPVLAMRSWRRSVTAHKTELLLTSPVSLWENSYWAISGHVCRLCAALPGGCGDDPGCGHWAVPVRP